MYVLSGMCIRTKKKSYLHSVDVLGGGGRRCRVRRARWCPSPLSLSRGMDILEVKHTTKASNEGKSIYSPHLTNPPGRRIRPAGSRTSKLYIPGLLEPQPPP